MTFDADGGLISTTVQEPRFTPDEVAILLASRREDMRPRNAQGILLSEATDPANESAFEVPLPLTDFAEKALSTEQKKYRQRWGDDALDNQVWRVEKKR